MDKLKSNAVGNRGGGGSGDLTRPLKLEEKINMANELGLPEYPQIKNIECINEDTIKVTQLEEGKTYTIPFYHNLRSGAFKNINANTIQGDESIKEFIDRGQGAYLIARLGNIEIYKSDLTVYSTTIYNYTNFPTSPASDSFSDGYYTYLIIKEIKSSGATYYFTSVGTSARSNTSGIMADVPIMASATFDYPNEQMERIGSTDIPGVTEGCSVIAWLMRGIWFRVEFDSNGKQLGDCFALGNEGMKPTLTRGLNEFNLTVTYKESDSEINNLDALLEILNGSTYQGLNSIDYVGTYAIQYQLPKYLDLLNIPKYKNATSSGNAISLAAGSGNTPDVTNIKFIKALGYWKDDENVGNPSYRINKDIFVIEFSGLDWNRHMSSESKGAYIYSTYDLNDIKLILGDAEFDAMYFSYGTQNVKAYTWYYFNRQAQPELVEIPRCNLWVESNVQSTSYYSYDDSKAFLLELLNSEGAKDENGNFITFERKVGVLTKDDLNDLQEQIYELEDTTQGLNNNLEGLQENFDNFTESTQESLDDLQEQIDNIQPGGDIEPLYNKIYKGGSPKELVDGETYTLRSDIDLSNVESGDLLWCNYEINPIGTDIYWSKEDNRLNFYENETSESPEKDYYLIDGEWWSDSWKTSKVENPSFTYDANATEIENMELLLSILEGKEITLEEKIEEPIKNKVYEDIKGKWTLQNNWDTIREMIGTQDMLVAYQDIENNIILAYTSELPVPVLSIFYYNGGNQYIMLSEQVETIPANVWFNMFEGNAEENLQVPEINPEFIGNQEFFNLIVGQVPKKVTLKEKLMSYIEAGEGVSIEPNEDGTKLIVSASGGGGGSLYQHNITLRSNTPNVYRIYFNYINDNPNPTTVHQTFEYMMNTIKAISDKTSYQMSGAFSSNYIVAGKFREYNGKIILDATYLGNGALTNTNINEDNVVDFEDNVIEI